MGTKNYTYLEAGLPILVNDEYSYMKELVEENNIGLSLKSNNLSQINNFLKNIDIDLLKENVRKFNIKNNLFVKVICLKVFMNPYKIKINRFYKNFKFFYNQNF